MPPADVADEIHSTDSRINRAEQELRRELIVHVTVQGADDIGDVLGYILLIKKIERIGDQAKNVFDLSDEGVDFSGADDVQQFIDVHMAISAMLDEVAELPVDPDPQRVADFRVRADAMRAQEEGHIREWMHSDLPGHHAVPRAGLHRYLKRIIANIAGVITTITEPIQHQGYFDQGTTDITDD